MLFNFCTSFIIRSINTFQLSFFIKIANFIIWFIFFSADFSLLFRSFSISSIFKFCCCIRNYISCFCFLNIMLSCYFSILIKSLFCVSRWTIFILSIIDYRDWCFSIRSISLWGYRWASSGTLWNFSWC